MTESNTTIRPLVSVTVRPVAGEDEERLQHALSEIGRQDHTLKITIESEGRAVVAGMSEPQLESVCDRLLGEYKLGIDVSEPAIVYVETIRKASEAEGKYVRQTGGRGNYGHCKLRIEPNGPGKGYEFIDNTEGDVIPEEFIKSIDQSVQASLNRGVLAGFPIVDVKVTLFDGSYHEADSNEMAFRFAASMAFKEAAQKAWPIVMEPIMEVEVEVPEELAGAAIDDIDARRGRIQEMEHTQGSQLIKAMVPFSEMLSSSPRGRLDYPMQFVGYEPAHGGGWFGGDEPGVRVENPRFPKQGRGFAAANPDSESE